MQCLTLNFILIYAAYVRGEDGTFYIFSSELANYTTSLLANPVCSILLAAPESETKNFLVCERIFLRCDVEELARGTKACDCWIDQLQVALGNTVEVLKSLPDFHLFALKPSSGQYTLGFGRILKVSADGSLSRVVPDKK